MRFSARNLILIGIAVVLLAAIPLTMYFVEQQQQTRSHAAKSTTLSFLPASTTTSVGQSVNLDLMVTPGQNQVSYIKLFITYDQTKVTASQGAFLTNASAFPAVIQQPVYTPGSITATIAIGADPTKVIQTPTKAATITFKAIAGGTAQIAFGTQTQVLSAAETDTAAENVLSTTSPATITVNGGTTTPVPTTPPGNGIQQACGTTVNSFADTTITTTDTRQWDMKATQGSTTLSYDTSSFPDKIQVYDTDGSKILFDSGNVATNGNQTKSIAFGPGSGTKLKVVVADGGGGNSATGWIYSLSCPGVIGPTLAPAPTETPRTGGGTGGTGGNAPTPSATAAATFAPTAMPTVAPTAIPTAEAPQANPTLKPGPGDTVLQVGIFGAVLAAIGAVILFAL